GGRPGGGRHPGPAQARALQGQGRPVQGRARPPQGGQGRGQLAATRTGRPMSKLTKQAARRRRHFRVRKKVAGTPERPRLAVHRSNKHISAQVIDDQAGRTLASASTLEADLRSGSNTVEAAKKIGQLVAERAKAQGITSVVFDRGGNL